MAARDAAQSCLQLVCSATSKRLDTEQTLQVVVFYSGESLGKDTESHSRGKRAEQWGRDRARGPLQADYVWPAAPSVTLTTACWYATNASAHSTLGQQHTAKRKEGKKYGGRVGGEREEEKERKKKMMMMMMMIMMMMNKNRNSNNNREKEVWSR